MKDSEKGENGVDRHSIREVRSYVDDKGREVKEFVAVYGKEKEPSFFHGRAIVQIRSHHPQGIPMPPQMQPFEFEIDASSVRGAFERFDDAAKAELERMRKEQEKRNLVVAARNVPQLLGLDGKPIKKGG